MWDRKELKAKGKAAYNANKIACIIAALILMLAGGIGSVSTSSPSFTAKQVINNNNGSYEAPADENTGTIQEGGNDAVQVELNGQNVDVNGSGNKMFPIILSTAVIALLCIVLTVGLMLSALVLNPLNVGARRFFIQNASNPETHVDGNNIAYGFGSNYRDIVFSMFGTQIINMLWALLLVIPGIYKAYCWRLVPYIIADNPGISGKKARAMSTDMMNGSKWASFVLDLSFVGWRIVGALTLGIVNIVFTNPYQAASETEMYLTLKDRAK